MPNVNGKKFPYTASGMAMVVKPAVKKAMIKKMSKKAY